jgi:hypothetical protein
MTLSGTLIHTPNPVVRLGNGVVSAEFVNELDKADIARPFAVTSPLAANAPAYLELVKALGARRGGSSQETAQHPPRRTVLGLAAPFAASTVTNLAVKVVRELASMRSPGVVSASTGWRVSRRDFLTVRGPAHRPLNEEQHR